MCTSRDGKFKFEIFPSEAKMIGTILKLSIDAALSMTQILCKRGLGTLENRAQGSFTLAFLPQQKCWRFGHSFYVCRHGCI